MTGPSKVPGSRTVRSIGDDPGSQLRRAGDLARTRPSDEWTYVGWSRSPVSEVEARFVREVIAGNRSALGPGLWDATCEPGIVRDGEPICLSDLPNGPEPGEEVVTLKYVAFCGEDDDTDA